MKWISGLFLLLTLGTPALSQVETWGESAPTAIRASARVDDARLQLLLSQMTWKEKCGQITQYAGILTGPQPIKPELFERIATGEIGSVLSVSGVERCRKMQDEALKSRLKIPLLFAFDVIHGYRTIFPIPLAEAASFEPELAELSARISATEAAAAGVNWTFAPMVDLARDPRWGRVIEGAGEDPYMGAIFAAARVRGFQGDDLSQVDTLAACAKHLGGYGAAEGGRDYDTSEISEMTLRESYFPPFQAAMAEGVATVMPSFQEMAGRPSHANTFLLDDVLRGEWKFPGVVVSDYGAIEELLKHRVAGERNSAGQLALNAKVDIDMMSDIYRTLPRTEALEKQVDEAVLRVLALKRDLGLFNDPYRYLDSEREKQTVLRSDFRKAARSAAAKGAVLLENNRGLLPLDLQTVKRVAVVGPLASDTRSALGEWNLVGRTEDTISPLVGLKNNFESDGLEVVHAMGCPAWEPDETKIDEAVELANGADLVIAVVGEPYDVTGESRNRTKLGLPGSQLSLLRALAKTGKPVVTVLANGRPLTLEEVKEVSPTLLVFWHAGIEAGNGLYDALVGKEPIGGKLPMTFPRNVGQIPLYYNRKTSGRPPAKGQEKYRVDYFDSPLTPLYPFGFGLTTSTFRWGDRQLVSSQESWPLIFEFTLTNTGKRTADEVPQLYLIDEIRSVTPPRRELKGFERVTLEPGESRKVRFQVDKKDLQFIGLDYQPAFEPGWYGVAIGADSDAKVNFRVQLSERGASKTEEVAESTDS